MRKKFTKKALSLAIAMIMVLSAAIVPVTGITASAANDTMDDALLVEFGTEYSGEISKSDAYNYYKVTLEEAGKLSVDILAFCDAYYELYGQNKEGILTYRSVSISYTPGFKNEVVNIYLTAGTYYFCMHRWDMNGEYNITFEFESSNETIKEAYGGSNETMNTALEIALNQKYYGVVAKNESYDFYKFTLEEKTKVTIKFHTDNASWVQFYNSKGTELYGDSYVNNDYTNTGDDIKEYTLEAGTYYYVVRSTNGIHSTYSLIVESEKVEYTINYNATGGSVSTSSVTVEKGNSVTLPTPSKSYKLTYNLNGGSGSDYYQNASTQCLGWSDSSSATNANYLCGTSYTPSANKTLYAVWGNAEYRIYGDIPVRDGYTFLGWSSNASATIAVYEAGDIYIASGNSTLYAVWEKNVITDNGEDDNENNNNENNGNDESGFDIGGFFLSIFEKIIGFFVMIIDLITSLINGVEIK